MVSRKWIETVINIYRSVFYQMKSASSKKGRRIGTA